MSQAQPETGGVSISQECGPQVGGGNIVAQDSHLWRCSMGMIGNFGVIYDLW